MRSVRSEWNITARRTMPSEGDIGTYCPVEQAPEKPAPHKFTMALGRFFDSWRDALWPLKEHFVPDGLRRGPAWDDFFGACVMCDPPDDRLLEFAGFGAVYPSLFWSVVDCELDEIDASKVHSMIAPPVERVFKESYEGGEAFMEYRIVVDQHTKEEDMIHAFRAIKAASNFRNPGGKPPIDGLVAVQCAVLYDDHNGTDLADRRVRAWTYKKLADKFRGLGVKNERSAEEHVKRGRELRS